MGGTPRGAADDGAERARFEIAGADRKFVWADAAIEGETVVVSSPAVRKPVAVRYAWANNPEGCNLYNREGLPAVPFRTDQWPGVTAPRKRTAAKPAAKPKAAPTAKAKPK